MEGQSEEKNPVFSGPNRFDQSNAAQHRIVQKLEQLLQTCDTLQASIRQSQAYKEQLLQQVLREALQEK